MRRSSATRAASSAALLLASCLHGRPIPVPTGSPLADDAVIASLDAAGLAGAAERLCTPLASRPQKQLGFDLARRAAAAVPSDRGLCLLLSRCAFLWADWITEDKELLAVSQVGMEAARAAQEGAGAKDPRVAYLRALNEGLNARLRGLDAIGMVGEIIEALKTAGAAPEQEQGGPVRVLGMLYLKAPPWPAGPGDLEASLELLKDVAAKYPSHPQNHLFLAEALLESGDKKAAAAELEKAQAIASPLLWGDYAERWQGEIAALKAKAQ